MKKIAILGSTGSIGHSTLRIVESYPDRFQVVTLAAGNNLDVVCEQVRRFQPKVVSVATEENVNKLKSKLSEAGLQTEVLYGTAGTVRVATHPDVNFVVSAIVGVAGLEPVDELAALHVV